MQVFVRIVLHMVTYRIIFHQTVQVPGTWKSFRVLNMDVLLCMGGSRKSHIKSKALSKVLVLIVPLFHQANLQASIVLTFGLSEMHPIHKDLERFIVVRVTARQTIQSLRSKKES
jgi:hypothetical protein